MEINSLLFKFDDHRNEKGKGHVIGPGNRIFNHFDSATNNRLRLKFLAIFFINVPKGALIFLTKCADFLSAGSIIRGVEAGKHEFRLYRLKMYDEDETVHRFAKTFFVAKCVCTSVVKDIVTIATYPICIFGLQCAALAGMASPLDGWVFTCILEEMWDQDIHKRIGHGGITLIPQKVMQLLRCTKKARAIQLDRSILFYVAPCMQSQQNFKEKNIYRIALPYYNPQTLRSLKLQFSNLVKESAPYLRYADENLFNKSIHAWSTKIAEISPYADERYETDANGDFIDTAKEEAIKKLKDTMMESIRLLNLVVSLTDIALELNAENLEDLSKACPTTLRNLREAVSS